MGLLGLEPVRYRRCVQIQARTSRGSFQSQHCAPAYRYPIASHRIVSIPCSHSSASSIELEIQVSSISILFLSSPQCYKERGTENYRVNIHVTLFGSGTSRHKVVHIGPEEKKATSLNHQGRVSSPRLVKASLVILRKETARLQKDGSSNLGREVVATDRGGRGKRRRWLSPTLTLGM